MAAPAERYLSLPVREQICLAIAEADGNEVFFIGQRGAGGVVESVRVAARGTRQAVLALSSGVQHGDIVLHNHPSGELSPSRADMQIASALADEGVGFYIVDNEACFVYAVVEGFAPEREPQRLDPVEVASLFAADGPLARSLEGYEPRPGQGRLAAQVVEAFNGNRIALLEAGTGTGKSLAYLVPAALWALRNRERVLVATGTINLQEQLVGQDLVVLQRILAQLHPGQEMPVALIKGRSNYLCLRRLALALKEQLTLLADEHTEQLQAIAGWAVTSSAGTRQDLPFEPSWELWDELAVEADNCPGLTCPHHAGCFYMASRRAAARAALLVANHHLFFADVALRAARGRWRGGAVLPEYWRVVLDEAHRLEDAASSFFGGQVTRHGLKLTLGRLHRQRSEGSQGLGLLLTARAELARLLPDRGQAILQELLPEVAECGERVEQTFRFILDWVRALAAERRSEQGEPEQAGTLQLRLTPGVLDDPGWCALRAEGAELAARLRTLGGMVMGLVGSIERLIEEREDAALENLRIELQAAARRLAVAATELDRFLAFPGAAPGTPDDDGLVRWIEARVRRHTTVQLQVAPLEIRKVLAESLFSKVATCILTSATLSTQGSGDGFGYLTRRLGLDELPAGRVCSHRFPSPFRYDEQALVGIVLDLPDPGGAGFASACAETVLEAVTITGGRAFVLFTSYSLLRTVHGRLEAELRARGLVPLRQGELPRTQLLERFRSCEAGVLFGTDSFWEGVDVRGRALENVVIVRLPFRVPTEPLIEARVEALQAQGGNPFKELALPQAVIRFRQGFGRLIRSRTDRGMVLILDRRARTRYYGKMFLQALPPGISVLAGPGEEMLSASRAFFGEREG